MKRIIATSIITTILAIPASAKDLPSVSDVTGAMDQLYRSKSSVASMKMSVKTKHFSRTLELEAWSLSDTHSLMVIRSPSREAGTATLKTPDGLWNYAPRADRLMRIPSAMLSDGWMGSHVTHDDLMRDSSFEKDYDTTIAWADGGKHIAATLIPKKDAAIVYSKVVMTFTAEGYLPVRADYYDGKDIVRKWEWSNIKTLGGRKLPTVMRITPTDKADEFTEMTYTEMAFDGDLDTGLFTPRGLKRAARK